jgi:hypothetical protein
VTAEAESGFAAAKARLHFVAMSFRVVLVSLAVFLVARGLVRSVAERLVLGQATHANPNRFLLRLDLKGSLVRLQYFAHAKNLAR